MGGNALKSLGIESRRINTQELLDLTKKAQELTGGMFLWLKPVKFYHSKPDHGDIDLIALVHPGYTESREQTPEEKKRGFTPPPRWVEETPKLCQSAGIHWNAPVASIELDGVQVDISGHKDQDLAQAHLNFSHYSPTGNVVGRMA